MKRSLIKRISAVIALTLSISLVSCTTNNNATADKNLSFTAGTYTATGKGNNGDIKIEVTVSDSKIEDIKVTESSETPGLGDVALDSMIESILSTQSIGVDTVTGATNSSNGLLEALEACLTEAGGDLDSLKVSVEKNGEDEVMETEVVVIGGGASGTAAALQATDDGGKVILVEMTASPAGQGTMAGGMFATSSTEQKEKGELVDNKWIYDQFVNTSNYTANGGLLTKIIQNSGDTVDWLEENGCDLVLAHPATGGYYEHRETHQADTLHGYAEGGTVALTKLHKSIEEKGGTVLYSTKATELIIEDGVVKGIIAEKADGGKLTINAQSVILATGGFGGNEEKVAETFGEGFGVSRVATNIGTGIELAKSAGAAASYEDAITMHYGVSRGGTKWNTTLNAALLNPYLHVDVDGNRFMNEEAFIFEPIKSSNVIKSLPQRTAYEIFDSTMIETVKEKGFAGITDVFSGELAEDPTVFIEVGHPVNTAERYEASITPEDLTAEIEALVAEGKIIKAESPEELAEKLGMSNLVDTINRYNELCAAGEDTDHFKSAKYLDNLEGTLYAVKITPSVFLGTLGGIDINADCEVLDANGKAISGLYAAGSETNGAYGNSYVYFEGGTLGYAYGTGRIAGSSAVKNLNK